MDIALPQRFRRRCPIRTRKNRVKAVADPEGRGMTIRRETAGEPKTGAGSGSISHARSFCVFRSLGLLPPMNASAPLEPRGTRFFGNSRNARALTLPRIIWKRKIPFRERSAPPARQNESRSNARRASTSRPRDAFVGVARCRIAARLSSSQPVRSPEGMQSVRGIGESQEIPDWGGVTHCLLDDPQAGPARSGRVTAGW